MRQSGIASQCCTTTFRIVTGVPHGLPAWVLRFLGAETWTGTSAHWEWMLRAFDRGTLM